VRLDDPGLTNIKFPNVGNAPTLPAIILAPYKLEYFFEEMNKSYYKYIITAILFSLSLGSAKSQSIDECKYLMVLNYLKTNLTVNERLKLMFVKSKLANKKDKYVEFKISPKIIFISLGGFRDSLKSSELGISSELIESYDRFREKYHFSSFKSDFLKKIAEPNDSQLYLTFSKPIGNFLVVEIGSTDPEMIGVRQFGIGVTLLFIFDSSGFIQKTFDQYGVYN
jgi:hypothetical protein